jgi:hypothetical protein
LKVEDRQFSLLWAAPEMLVSDELDEKADVYSLGVIIWELYTMQSPWSDIGMQYKINELVVAGSHNTIPDHTPPKLKQLFLDCWKLNPAQRPSASEVADRLDELLFDTKQVRRISSSLNSMFLTHFLNFKAEVDRLNQSGLVRIEESGESVALYRRTVRTLVENGIHIFEQGPGKYGGNDHFLALLCDHIDPLTRLPESCFVWFENETTEKWTSFLLQVGIALIAAERRARANFYLSVAQTFVKRYGMATKERELDKIMGNLLLTKIEDVSVLAPTFAFDPLPLEQLRAAVERLHLSRSRVPEEEKSELEDIDKSLLEAEAVFSFEMAYNQAMERLRSQNEPLVDIIKVVQSISRKLLSVGKYELAWILITGALRNIREIGRTDDGLLPLLLDASNFFARGVRIPLDLSLADWPKYRERVESARDVLYEKATSGPLPIDATKAIARDFSSSIRDTLADIAAVSERLLGPCPVKYCLYLLGSLAGSDAMPYSSIKCGLLVSEDEAADWEGTFDIFTSKLAATGPAAGAIYIKSWYRVFEFAISSIGEPNGLHVNLLLNPRKEPRLRGTPESIFQSSKPPHVPLEDPLLYSFMCGTYPLVGNDDGVLIEQLNTLFFNAFISPVDALPRHTTLSGIQLNPIINQANASSSSSNLAGSGSQAEKAPGGSKPSEDLVAHVGSNQGFILLPQKEFSLLQRQIAMAQLDFHVSEYEKRAHALLALSGEAPHNISDVIQRFINPLKFGLILMVQYNFLLPDNVHSALKAIAEKHGLLVRAFADLCDQACAKLEILRMKLEIENRTAFATHAPRLTEDDLADLEMLEWAVVRPVMYGLRQLISAGELYEDPAEVMLQEEVRLITPHLQDMDEMMHLVPQASTAVQAFVFSRAGMKEPVRSYKDSFLKLPEQLRFKFIGFFRAVPRKYTPPNAQQVWAALYLIPSENGDRPILTKLSIEWRDSLSKLFVDNSMSNYSIRVAGDRDRFRRLTSAVEQQLFEENGCKLKSSESRGRHTVHRLEHNGTAVHLKERPEWQIMEYAVGRLYELVVGPDCTPQTTLWAVRHLQSNADDWIPIGVSQTVPGQTLQEEFMRNPQGVTQLDKKSFSQHVIMALLVNPEDGKSDNFIVTPGQDNSGRPTKRLVSIDNDHAFVPALVSRGLLRTTVLVKTIVFCFDEMKDPVHPDVCEEILQLNPLSLLKLWLADLRIREKEYCDMFTDERRQQLFAEEIEENRVIINMFVRMGLVEELFQKMRRLQDLLRANRKISHTELLQSLEPQLADFYLDVLRLPITPAERFKTLVRREYKGEMIAGAGTTKTTVSKTLLSVAGRLATEDQIKEHKFDAGIQKCIDMVFELQAKQDKIAAVCEQLIKEDNYRAFSSLSPECMKQAVVDLIPFSFLSPEVAKKVIKRIAGRDYASLRLAQVSGADWKLLHSLICSSKSMQHLDLTGCEHIGPAQVEIISKSCPRLGTLVMRNISTLTALIGTRLGFAVPLAFPTLRHLWISGCTNLVDYDVEAPRLSDIDYEGCSKLPLKRRWASQEAPLEGNQSFISSVFKSPLTRIRMEDGSTAIISVMRSSAAELNTGVEEMMYDINNKQHTVLKDEITAVTFYEPMHFVISGDRKGDIIWWNYESSAMVHKESIGLPIRSLSIHGDALVITAAPKREDGEKVPAQPATTPQPNVRHHQTGHTNLASSTIGTSSTSSSAAPHPVERAKSDPLLMHETRDVKTDPKRPGPKKEESKKDPKSPGPVFITTAAPGSPMRQLDLQVTCIHAKNSLFACGLATGGILMWDINEEKPIREIFVGEEDGDRSKNQFSAVLQTGIYIVGARMLYIDDSTIQRPVVKVWSTAQNKCVATLGIVDTLSNSTLSVDSANEGESILTHAGLKTSNARRIYQWKISGLVMINDHLVTSSWDGKVVVWNLKSFELVKELFVSHHAMMGIAVQRDHLVAACADGSIRLFPIRDLLRPTVSGPDVPMRTFFAHKGGSESNIFVWRSAFATTADLIATGGHEGHIKVWRIRPPEGKKRVPVKSTL